MCIPLPTIHWAAFCGLFFLPVLHPKVLDWAKPTWVCLQELAVHCRVGPLIDLE